MASPLPPGLHDALVAIVGPSHVLDTDELVAGYSVDWMGRFRGRAAAVVRPGTVDEVAAVVGACARAGVPMVPQGGNTGLVGGSVPLAGEIVVSMRRLDTVGPVDLLAAEVTAGAGVTLEALHRHARQAGLGFGVDLAARGSATVGGMVATNAGGIHVLRHGPMRAQVVGIEAVLADGSVLRHLGGLIKDNTGYDLAGLLCGSEGTLGIVTAARLRLVTVHRHRVTVALGCPSIAAAVEVLAGLRRRLEGLEACELMRAGGVAMVARHLGLDAAVPDALRAPVSLLVEVAAHRDPTDEVAAAVGVLAPALVCEPVVAVTTAQRDGLWRFRESHTDAINALGPPVKLDVTLPLPALDRFCGEVEPIVAAIAPGSSAVLFGHVGDGNVHVNVIGVAPGSIEAVEDAVLGLVSASGGSISAEHGIGTMKRHWLHLSRSPAEIAAMRAIKASLDPHGRLNPNVLLPPVEPSTADPASADPASADPASADPASADPASADPSTDGS